jgi:hypothetical protein
VREESSKFKKPAIFWLLALNYYLNMAMSKKIKNPLNLGIHTKDLIIKALIHQIFNPQISSTKFQQKAKI